MTLSIKDGRYAFLISLDLMSFMSLSKQFELLQILNALSIRHLIKIFPCKYYFKIENENNKKCLK